MNHFGRLSAGAGEILELPHPPISVNVQVKRWPNGTAEETLSEPGDEEHAIIPLKTTGWQLLGKANKIFHIRFT